MLHSLGCCSVPRDVVLIPGMLSSQPFPGSQCLLLQGRRDGPGGQTVSAGGRGGCFYRRREQCKDIPSHRSHAAARHDPSPQKAPLPPRHAVPFGCWGRAAGQECGRHRERAQANHPSCLPEDFDPWCFSSSPADKAGKAAGSQLGWGGGTIKNPSRELGQLGKVLAV